MTAMTSWKSSAEHTFNANGPQTGCVYVYEPNTTQGWYSKFGFEQLTCHSRARLTCMPRTVPRTHARSLGFARRRR